MKLFTDFIIPLLFYSGPLIPAIGLVCIRFASGFMHFKKTVIILSILHFAAFVPYAISAAYHLRDSLHLLLLPALTSFLSFPVGIVLLIIAIVRTKNNKKRTSEQRLET